ncbi:transposase, partial [Halalkalibacterium halodurans]|uniref:transposase n=1 Tax=Halalkalibacterium halodurans TaxID=86665 RepID=UPI001FBAE91A
QTLKNWQTEILNSFAFGLNNGFIEGLNNQTKVIKRNAFGFRRWLSLRRVRQISFIPLIRMMLTALNSILGLKY